MFGKRLKELREQHGYSMDKLVELYNDKYDAKMNKSTLSRYENSIQDPIYTVVVNFANFFDVSVDYLIGTQKEISNINNMLRTPEEEAELNEYLEAVHNDPNLRMMFSLAKDAKKEDVEKAVAIIKALLGKE